MEIRRRSPSPKIRVSYLEYGVPHDDEKPRNILEKIVWEKDRAAESAVRSTEKKDQLAATYKGFRCRTQAGTDQAGCDCRGEEGQPQ